MSDTQKISYSYTYDSLDLYAEFNQYQHCLLTSCYPIKKSRRIPSASKLQTHHTVPENDAHWKHMLEHIRLLPEQRLNALEFRHGCRCSGQHQCYQSIRSSRKQQPALHRQCLPAGAGARCERLPVSASHRSRSGIPELTLHGRTTVVVATEIWWEAGLSNRKRLVVLIVYWQLYTS